MIDHDLAYSRPRATAMKLAASAADAHRFTDKVVLLTGEEETLASKNGEFCFVDGLRLLPRTVKKVDIFVPTSLPALRARAETIARTIEFGNPIRFLDKSPGFHLYDAILNVGWQVRPNLPWTTINSNGWVARASSKLANLPRDCDQANPIGALAAASLGVTDVFKRLIRLRPEMADLFDGLQFSLYTYETGQPSPGPLLPSRLALPSTLLAGGGAIGNGISLLLTQLKPTGDLWTLDRQKYGSENLGTCVLLAPAGVGAEKAEYLALQLKSVSGLNAAVLSGDIASLKSSFGSEAPYPHLVLSGFDNVPARHQLQDLWPDRIIDGGISDFGVQVFSHVWGSGHQCLKCHFAESGSTNPQRVAAEASGLGVDRIANPDDAISEEDVALAPAEKQDWLRERIGKKICSVASEATMKLLGSHRRRENFSPSVPFVACMSAAFVVGRAVQMLTDPGRNITSKFIFDMLQGPENGMTLQELAAAKCDCVRRADIIDKWRLQRERSA